MRRIRSSGRFRWSRAKQQYRSSPNPARPRKLIMLRREFRCDGRCGRRALSRASGMTLLELIISCSVLLILSSMALPIFRYAVIREKETELRYDLRSMKDAIDRYKELADQHKFRTEVGSDNYPPDLETLVRGVQIATGNDKRLR